MAHDRRTYRFHQDTRNGRILIAKSQSAEAIAAAVADYVARRLIERERALATESRRPLPLEVHKTASESQKATRQDETSGPPAWPLAGEYARTRSAPVPRASEAFEAAASDRAARPRHRFIRRLGDVMKVFVMMLGSITLALLIGLGGYLAWTMRLRDLWAQWTSPPL
jgi:hypothetical protein